MPARRVTFTGVGATALEPFEVGAIGDDEILVETEYSVVSPGTERANLLAQPNTDTAASGFPFRPGYSNVGRVIRCGSDVHTVRVGDRVATMAVHQSHLVVHAPLRDVRSHWPYAHERPVDLSRMSWPLPGHLGQDERRACAAFILAAVGLYGIRCAQVSAGDRVVIVGLGPIGLLAGQFARLAGGLPVTGIAATASLRDAARGLGFDEVLTDLGEVRTVSSRADDCLRNRAMKTVFVEATGRAQSVCDVLEACPEGARVVLLGCTRGIVEAIDLYRDVQRKALTIVGAHQPTRSTRDPLHSCWLRYWDADVALRMILTKRVDVGALVRAEFDVGDHRCAYDAVAQGSPGVVFRWF